MKRNNLAGRIGAWAAANPKDAIFGWIAFVAIAVALGAHFGTKPMPERESTTGESAKADQILARVGLSPPVEEAVLVQITRLNTPTEQLYKAVRDYRSDRESSFRNFAELCIHRQIITAVKTASRNKHTPLNRSVSFATTPAGAGDGETTLDEMLPGPTAHDPVNQVISSEELQALVACLSTVLSELESRVLALYLDGYSYEQVGAKLGCEAKTVDNALQRVKRKVGTHLQSRNVQL